MSESWNIRNFEDLVASNLENGEKIFDKKISVLTAPGENYGSIMLRVDVHLKNEQTGKDRTLSTVAKLIPESELTQEWFNTQLTYRNEYKFYAEIVPAFDRLLKSSGISNGADFTARFFGGRLNLDGSEVVTSDAVILMENLKPAGYTMGIKAEGFNIEESKMVLNALAKFHAAGIALKHKQPQIFKDIVEPHCYYFIPPDNLYDMILTAVLERLKINGFTPEEINIVAKYKKKEVEKPEISETWGTIVHYDSWTNNFLIKYDDTKPVHAAMVDFQVCDYKSSLNDVMFFLLTSVQIDIFDNSVDTLLEHYHKQLLDYLGKLGVDTKRFNKNSFEEQIKFAVQHTEYTHALWMSIPIMHEAFTSVGQKPKASDFSEKHVNKILQITRMCLKKGWFNEN